MSVRIIQGDCREMLRTLPEESVHCVVTSPPYWGLRDYNVAGQLGMEPTLGEHIAMMVDVFREVRRVLRKDGTLWLNYGDCYATSPAGWTAARYKAEGKDDRTFRDKPFSTIGGVLKPKDLCMVPNRIAIALQEAGWWVRSEIVWHKPNPMPESIKDRPGTSHEKVWLLSKAQRYFYDGDAVSEQCAVPDWDDGSRVFGGINKHGANAKQQRTTGRLAVRAKDQEDAARPPQSRPHNLSKFEADNDRVYQTRNCRNVWTIPTAAFSDAHFATFPPELVERCIKAGCPIDGTVLDPFGGSGTTGMVADRLGRSAILIELNPQYAEMARRRIESDAGMFAEVAAQ